MPLPSFSAFKDHVQLDLGCKLAKKEPLCIGDVVIRNGVSYTCVYGHIRGAHLIRTERHVTKIYDPEIMFLHLDGDKLNCDSENLYAVNRSVYFKSNRIFSDNPQLNKVRAMICELESLSTPTEEQEEQKHEPCNQHMSFESLYGIKRRKGA